MNRTGHKQYMSLEFVKSVDGKWKYSLLEIKASKKD